MINAALAGDLDNVSFEKHPIFGVAMPIECPKVPTELLNPRNTWEMKKAYDNTANHLADLFNANFEKYADGVDQETRDAAPNATASS